MKSFYTILMLLVATISFGQTASVEVRATNVCDELYTGELEYELYIINNLDEEVLLRSGVGVSPFVIDSLPANSSFVLKSVPQKGFYQYDIIDLLLMQNVILRIQKPTPPMELALDVTNDLKGSARDAILVRNHLIKQNQLDSYSIFIDKEFQNTLPIDKALYEVKNRLEFTTGAPNIRVDVDAIYLEEGQVTEASRKQCLCTADSNASATVHLPDVTVTEGVEVEASIVVEGNKDVAGVFLAFDYEDIGIEILDGVGSHVDTTNQIIYYLKYQVVPDNTERLHLRFTPKKDGKLSDFIRLREDPSNQIVYKQNSCYLNYPNFEIKFLSECTFTWPPQFVVARDCDAYSGSPSPDSECESTVQFDFEDTYVNDSDGNCIIKVREWSALNSLTWELSRFSQVIKKRESYPTVCNESKTIECGDTVVSITPEDILSDVSAADSYAFSLDPSDTLRTITYEYPYEEDVVIYNVIDSTFCLSKLTKVYGDCEKEINLIPTIEVANTDGFYVVLATSFDNGNMHYCEGPLTNFEIREATKIFYTDTLRLDYQTYKNQTITIDLRAEIDGEWQELEQVSAKLVEDVVEPDFYLTTYDDPVKENVPFDIHIQSPTFLEVTSLQGTFQIDNAEVIGVEKVSLPSNFNTYQEESQLRFVFDSHTTLPVSLPESEILWTIRVLPSMDGSVDDILSMTNEGTPAWVTFGSFEEDKYDFSFKMLKRNISASESIASNALSFHPNPIRSEQLIVDLEYAKTNILRLVDQRGQTVYKQNNLTNGRNIITLPSTLNGMYYIQLITDEGTMTKKLVVIE